VIYSYPGSERLYDMADSVDVGSINDFPAGNPRIVRVSGRELGIVRWGNNFYALENSCPHQQGPLCLGTVHAMLTGDASTGQLERNIEEPVLACAWHGWEFQVRSGRNVVEPRLRAHVHSVSVVSNRLLVSPERSPAEPADGEKVVNAVSGMDSEGRVSGP
jgi:nitrite reductase (NADH) small subunit